MFRQRGTTCSKSDDLVRDPVFLLGSEEDGITVSS
jgi:hypothetical protein